MSDAFSIRKVQPVDKVKLDGASKEALNAYGKAMKHLPKHMPSRPCGAGAIKEVTQEAKELHRVLTAQLQDRIRNIINVLFEEGAPEDIVKKVIDDFLAKRGLSVKSLWKADVETLKELERILYSKEELRKIFEKMVEIEKKQVMENITKLIKELAGRTGKTQQEVWNMIKAGMQRAYSYVSAQLSDGGADEVEALAMQRDLAIINNFLKGVENITESLSRRSLKELNNFYNAIRRCVNVATLRTAGGAITNAILLAKYQVLIPAGSTLGRILLSGAGVAAAGTGGWIIGRIIGGKVTYKGKNVDTYVQQYFENHMPNNNIIGVKRHNTQWGDLALKQMFNKKNKKRKKIK